MIDFLNADISSISDKGRYGAQVTSIMELLINRHTIRNYDQQYSIPRDVIDRIMEAVRLSPTASSIQDVDFLVCMNREVNQRAADAQMREFDEATRAHLASREKNFKVKNVLTCDASAEVIIYRNERSGRFVEVHAGLAAMAICVAAKDYGLDTMCHVVMCGEGAESVYGIPNGASIVAVAIGKALPDAHISARCYNNKITVLE